MIEEKRFAVLIDADNVSAKYIKYILDEVSNYGVATYKRIYGDWTQPSTSSWKDILLENSVTPIQQYSYTQGKNSTDSAMIIDAMDILYSGHVEGFCVVSSDSDFTKLASRLRESGMLVVGMGEKKTPKPFISACNQFKYLDVIAESEKKSLYLSDGKPTVVVYSEQDKKQDIESSVENKQLKLNKNPDKTETVKNMTNIEDIEKAIKKMLNDVDEGNQGIYIAEVGNRLVRKYPDFDVRNYGHTKLSKFLKKFDFIDINAKGNNGKAIWVSLKTTKTHSTNTIQPKTTKKRKRTNKKRVSKK